LVGDGILRSSLEARIREYGLADKFIFVGLVEPETIPQYIGAMDVLVHTSLREGLARALPQALLAGKPVISYDIDGAREVVIAGETGWLLPPKTVSELADAVVAAANDAQIRQRMGQTGRSRFTDQFRHQVMTQRIRQIYGDILAKSG
jgi:glycosyltransferase involved in cell wall biosynthesis